MKKFLLLRITPLLIIITVISWYHYSQDLTAIVLPNKVARDDIYTFPELKGNYEQIGRSFQTWLKAHCSVPAVSAGIVYRDRLVVSESVNCTADTKFSIASLSKTFTTLLVLQLEDEGLLNIDDPVRSYLPGVVIERNELGSEPVTIRHLLSHTTGMEGYGSSLKGEIDGKPFYLPKQVCPAGYNYRYCNRGFVLLKELIEKVSNMSFDDNLQKRIFRPLGMKSSTGKYSNGTGGIVTTLNDLAKYVSMLVNQGEYRGKRIISKSAFMDMITPVIQTPGAKTDYQYSLGWEVSLEDTKVDSFYKAGRWFHGCSAVQVYYRKGVAYLYLCNPPNHLSGHFMGFRWRLHSKLRSLINEITTDSEIVRELPTKPSIAIMKKYPGTYRNMETGEIITVSLRGNTLFRTRHGATQAMKSYNTNCFLIGTTQINNFIWKDDKVVGLALKTGYYEAVKGL